MRVDFTKSLQDIMAKDPKSLFLTGDLGFNALEKLQQASGPRFINAGVAEQNMIGLAAGLALEGYAPWVYSIAPFATYRCFEQIRNDICLHHLNVRVVGNGGGYTYGIMGSTHHALEDLGALKTLPNMRLFFPGTNDQVPNVVKRMLALPGPAYLRLGICGMGAVREPLHEHPVTLTRHYAAGGRLTVIGVGHAVQVALAALNQMQTPDILDVFGVTQFPFDLQQDARLRASINKTNRVIVVDEHYEAGGMAESLRALLPQVATFDTLCARYKKGQKYGSAKFHLQQSGMAPDDVLELIDKILRHEGSPRQ